MYLLFFPKYLGYAFIRESFMHNGDEKVLVHVYIQ